MRDTITISIPKGVKKELDKLSVSEGVSRSDIVRESLRDFLFIRNFRNLRQKMTAKAKALGIFTDEDVFDRIS